MSSKNKRPKLKPKVNNITIKCPCCNEILNIEISPNSTDFLIDDEEREYNDKIKAALNKNGIEFG